MVTSSDVGTAPLGDPHIDYRIGLDRVFDQQFGKPPTFTAVESFSSRDQAVPAHLTRCKETLAHRERQAKAT